MSHRPIIDAGPGARVATSEINRLQRLRTHGKTIGTVKLTSTLTVLAKAAGRKYIPDRATMRGTYRRLRELDDGLPPIQTTNLLSPEL